MSGCGRANSRDNESVAQIVYIDETGATGTPGGGKQPFLTLVAVLVDEDSVRPLAAAMSSVAMTHLGWIPADFEFHGNEIWQGQKHWKKKKPPELLAAYEAAIGLLDELDLDVAHATIDKPKLHARYEGSADSNAYRLALQFLLEKIDALGKRNRILVADEAKHERLQAIKMVADMQQWGGGEVPGRSLVSVIDSLHYVDSAASPGVQMADLVAYVLQRVRNAHGGHPDSAASLVRLNDVVAGHTTTWREPWPR